MQPSGKKCDITTKPSAAVSKAKPMAAQQTDSNTNAGEKLFYDQSIRMRDKTAFGHTTLLLMRAGERVDRVCEQWPCSRTDVTRVRYRPNDVNLPLRLERRGDELKKASLRLDPPLTVIGRWMAQSTAMNMSLNAFLPDVIYCSPAFRAIQTAIEVRKRMQKDSKEPISVNIRIEPGLFEFAGDYRSLPQFVDNARLLELYPDIALDNKYKAIDTRETMSGYVAETLHQYITRTARVLRKIASQEIDRLSLVISHASTLAAVTTATLDEQAVVDYAKWGAQFPYCSTVAMVSPPLGGGGGSDPAYPALQCVRSPLLPLSVLGCTNEAVIISQKIAPNC